MMGNSPLPNPVSTHSRRSRRPVHLSLQFILAVSLLLAVQFFILPQFFSEPSINVQKLSDSRIGHLQFGLQKCTEFNTPPVKYKFPVPFARTNPRWNPINGQKGTLILRNATLFDGESFFPTPVEILFNKGVVQSITPLSQPIPWSENVKVVDIGGKYVTPGLVDMHSHHLDESWPASSSVSDGNEVSPAYGPLTPFVRALDSIRPGDLATRIIASGGITSSLILPGSANIMGGEGFMVKNFVKGGEHGEPVVEEMLLEHGVPHNHRRRYMKMACGENPRGVYGHTRMGNAWIFRKQMSRAKQMREEQDDWCLSAAAALESGDEASIAAILSSKSDKDGGLPEELELESTVAILRGKMGVNIHCYEPEDFEDMLLHSKEFGFRIQAFHHALSAWKTPELIKDSGENITIATFAEFGLYKQEAYDANLWAGKILADHGVPVAYKSDHVEEETSAKFLMFQAATAHGFQLPEELALQSVTSVPAQSLELNHRIGYVRPGYDADVVVWNMHPLLVGATPLQVYIDGRPTLDPNKVADTLPKIEFQGEELVKPNMRSEPTLDAKEGACQALKEGGGKVVITGIKTSFLKPSTKLSLPRGEELTMVLNSGKLDCFGVQDECASASIGGTIIKLENGHVMPGLTALSSNLGLAEISTLEPTMDGTVSNKVDVTNADEVVYAKYGVHLEGRAFKRARIGGVTKAITAPVMEGGFLGGVSVGLKTNERKTILNGGIFQDNVALHFTIGQDNKEAESTPTVSSGIQKLRKILFDNIGKDSIYGKAANGSIPIVVKVESKYDIMQLIKLKSDHGKVNLVVNGGAGAPAVADELAAANIPVILNPFRRAPAKWETLDALVGPPLTRSSAKILSDAGVLFGIAMGGFGDSHIHSLPLESSWAAKYAGLSKSEAVDLVSRNIESIFGLEVDEDNRDFVVFEGDPLELGAVAVVTVDEEKKVVDCWPGVGEERI